MPPGRAGRGTSKIYRVLEAELSRPIIGLTSASAYHIDRAFDSYYVEHSVNVKQPVWRIVGMVEETAVSGPIRLFPRTEPHNYRESQDRARSERHERAATEAAGLFQRATAERPAERPIWVRAVILLMEAIQADYATVTVVQGEGGWRCRITRGRGLEERPSRRWHGPPQQATPPGLTPTRVDIETLQPVDMPTPISRQPVPGATSSFHALLYPSGSNQPLGSLSLYSGRDLSLIADRVAFIDAVAALLARDLASAPPPDPSQILTGALPPTTQTPGSTGRRSASTSQTSKGPIAARDTLRAILRRRQHALRMFRRSAANDPPIERVVAGALDLTQRYLNPDRCVYAVRGAEGEGFRLAAGMAWEAGVIGRDHLSGAPDALAGYTLILGQPVVVEDLGSFPQLNTDPVLLACGTKSALTAPVRGQRGASGLLGAFSSRRRLFSPDEAEFLRGLADVIAAALYRKE